MLKKNKLLFTSVGLLVGVTVFATTSFVALANNSGYENFKKALFKMKDVTNYEVQANVEAYYNGEYIGKSNAVTKTNDDNQNYYEITQYSKDNEVIENFISYDDSNTTTIYRNNEITSEQNSIDSNYRNDSKSEALKASETKLYEALMDVMIGDSKNFIISDGNKVYANLDETQIPNLAQLGLSYASEFSKEMMSRSTETQSSSIHQGAMGDIKPLSQISIKNVDFKGEVGENNYIKTVYIEIEVGGIDETQKYVTYTFKTTVDVKNVGQTEITKPVISTEEKAL